MPSGKTEFTIEPGKQEIHMTRVFDAPRHLVFKAHTDPELIGKWWGPRSTTAEVQELDARPGGRWRIVHTDQDGSYGFHGVYHTVDEDFIVQTFEFEGTPRQVLLESLTLDEIDGKTKLSAHSVFFSVEARDAMVSAGMQDGAEETWDRLEELVTEGAGR